MKCVTKKIHSNEMLKIINGVSFIILYFDFIIKFDTSLW